ncbi:MAG: DNA polymerase IV [Deltaproteobacteria bacterium]|nr:DNA polymerase IV [Deltaproteobacteria bacterium]
MHLDMDAFFAAIEQRDDPSLVGKPVIIGALPKPGSRGVVSTASYEARKFGVHSAMPIGQAYKRCPQGVFIRPQFAKYKEASLVVREILENVSPRVSMASIDEAYVDLAGTERLLGTPRQIATRVKELIRERLRLTASVGIGPNRLIAKIASDFNKPDGLTIVEAGDVPTFLATLPIEKIPGIGKVTQASLNRRGVFTVGDLAKMSEAELVRRFGDNGGKRLFRVSRGQGSAVVGSREARKSISKERTFSPSVEDVEELRRVLLTLAGDIGRSLRREGLKGRTMQLKIRFDGFETHTRARTIEAATSADREIFHHVWDLYQTSPYPGRPVRLIGLGVSDFGAASTRQFGLFALPQQQRDDEMYRAIDAIGAKFGKKAIRPADALDDGYRYDKLRESD